MVIYKYFSERRFAEEFMERGIMKFGSLSYYRAIEDGGNRGDPKDGTLNYAPPEGIEITRIRDGQKFRGISFTSSAQNMFAFCASNELSANRAGEFGPVCVEVMDADVLIARLKARAHRSSKIDYANTICGQIEYRALDQIPGVDWEFPERIVFMKPPEYQSQAEYRIVLPLKPGASSNDPTIFVTVGNLTPVTTLHCF